MHRILDFTMENNFRMIAKTFFGFEEILANELKMLGAQDVEQGVRMVSFKGDKGFMYKANLALRTALKILKPIYFFKARDENALYKGISGVNWSKFISANQTFVIDATVHSEYFNHSEFIPKFINASDAREYTLVTLELIGKLKDCHANIMGGNPTLNSIKGNYAAPFQAKFIENKLVITGYYLDTLNIKDKLKIGDVISEINGKKVYDLIKTYLHIQPGSNYSAQLRDLPDNYLLRNNDPSLKIIVQRGNLTFPYDAPLADVRLTSFNNINYTKSTGHFLINNDIGYIYPARYRNDELLSIKKDFEHTKGIVIDMRCYPSDFMPFTFGNYIKSNQTDFVKFECFNISRPGSFIYSGKKDTCLRRQKRFIARKAG